MTGTFFLCFVITAGAHNTSASTPALPLAIGWTLAVMVFAGGPVSGEHHQPLLVRALAWADVRLNQWPKQIESC